MILTPYNSPGVPNEGEGTSFRFRAPSFESSDSESDHEGTEENIDYVNMYHTPSPNRSRRSVLEKESPSSLFVQWESEQRQIVNETVASSPAFLNLCSGLRQARQVANDSLQRSGNIHSPFMKSLSSKEQEMIRETAVKLQQLKIQSLNQLQSAEKKLHEYRTLKAKENLQAQKVVEEKHREEEESRLKESEKKKREEEKKKNQIEEQEKKNEAERKRIEENAIKKEALKEKAAVAKRVEEEKKIKIKEKETQNQIHKIRAERRIKRVETLEVSIKPILESNEPQVKQMRLIVKKKVGEACNQISSKPSSIRLVVEKLTNLLQDAKNAGQNYADFALDQIATKLVCRSRVITDFGSCYPVGFVIMMTCVHTPELIEVILGQIHKACVYTIPDNPKMKKDQTPIDYKKSLGFLEDSDSKSPDGLEDFTKYSSRMTILMGILAAVMQTAPWTGVPQPEGISIKDLWEWLARIVNDKPNLMTAPTILTILEVAGFELLRTYKKQFHKLLVLIAQEVCPRISKDVSSGAAGASARLSMFIADYEKDRCVLMEPEGRKMHESAVTAADEELSENNFEGGGNYNNERNNYPNRGRGRGRGRGRDRR